MRLASLVTAVIALAAVGCEGSNLSGTWDYQNNGNPGGYHMTLYLSEILGSVSGRAEYGGFAGGPVIMGRVTGWRTAGSFRLKVTPGQGQPVTYAGHIVGSDQLQGNWAAAPDTGWTAVFYRGR